jgi:hypothetical protein
VTAALTVTNDSKNHSLFAINLMYKKMNHINKVVAGYFIQFHAKWPFLEGVDVKSILLHGCIIIVIMAKHT